ncbi:MAG: 3-deoxy-D-manno-octulosonic acid transferase [Methyloligellaceae bacterium]
MARTGTSTPLLLRGYRATTGLLGPVSPLLLAWRQRKGKEDAARRGERVGIAGQDRPEGRLIWLHAASVGETNAALPLITALRRSHPAQALLLTTGTVTSAELAAARMPEGVIHQYVPLDAPQFVRRFLAHWSPDLALFMESEIWPNLVLESAAHSIPLALVNARMSQRSYARWRRRPRVARALFGRFGLVLAQSDVYARRFASLGAARCRTVGNLKIDAPAPAADPDGLEALRRAVGGRPVFLAASTHPGEEAAVLEAHAALAARHEGLLTILVPRHPRRGREAAEAAKALGLSAQRRSQRPLPEPGTEVYVADTIGELGLFYALAPVAFIGGSLVPHGGQNPIEAVRHSTAVISGPEVANFALEYEALESAGGCVLVRDPADLARAVDRLLSDADLRSSHLRKAHESVDAMGGALARTLEALQPLLEEEQKEKARGDH